MSATPDEISRRLNSERLIILNRSEMDALSGVMEVIRHYSTLGHGELTEAGYRGFHLVVEEPEPGEYAVRRFADRKELQLFMERRLGQYERMWDGCGCRIDYYETH